MLASLEHGLRKKHRYLTRLRRNLTIQYSPSMVHRLPEWSRPSVYGEKLTTAGPFLGLQLHPVLGAARQKAQVHRSPSYQDHKACAFTYSSALGSGAQPTSLGIQLRPQTCETWLGPTPSLPLAVSTDSTTQAERPNRGEAEISTPGPTHVHLRIRGETHPDYVIGSCVFRRALAAMGPNAEC